MATPTVNRVTRAQRLAGLWVLSATTFAAIALWAPRGVRPRHLPVLHLDAAALDAVEARDRALAEKAPHGRWPRELRELYAEAGRTARAGTQAASYLEGRARRMKLVTRAVRERHGEEGLWALRAEVTQELQAALEERLPPRRQSEVLGNFTQHLAHYGVRAPDGRPWAPRGVVPSLFKARWNLMHSLDITAGLAAVEIQAHDGWLALHAQGAPRALRYQGAISFARAGGHRGQEAVAVWAIRLGKIAEARAALTQARQFFPAVHLRNYALGLDGP